MHTCSGASASGRLRAAGPRGRPTQADKMLAAGADAPPRTPPIPPRAPAGRSRWVVFGDPSNWRCGGTTVAPEWHGWLHAITDENPSNVSPHTTPRHSHSHSHGGARPGSLCGRTADAVCCGRPGTLGPATRTPRPPALLLRAARVPCSSVRCGGAAAPHHDRRALHAQGRLGEPRAAAVEEVRVVDAAGAMTCPPSRFNSISAVELGSALVSGSCR